MLIVDDFRKIKIRKTEQKLYVKPTVDDTAALIADRGEANFKRDIVVQKNDSKLQRINESHPASDALGYTLVYIKGDLGWSPEMVYTAKTKCRSTRKANANETKTEELHSDLGEQVKESSDLKHESNHVLV